MDECKALLQSINDAQVETNRLLGILVSLLGGEV